jgi:hypothetical protein
MNIRRKVYGVTNFSFPGDITIDAIIDALEDLKLTGVPADGTVSFIRVDRNYQDDVTMISINWEVTHAETTE